MTLDNGVEFNVARFKKFVEVKRKKKLYSKVEHHRFAPKVFQTANFLWTLQTFHMVRVQDFPFLLFRNSHRRCSVKKVFLEISQNLQENTCARHSL